MPNSDQNSDAIADLQISLNSIAVVMISLLYVSLLLLGRRAQLQFDGYDAKNTFALLIILAIMMVPYFKLDRTGTSYKIKWWQCVIVSSGIFMMTAIFIHGMFHGLLPQKKFYYLACAIISALLGIGHIPNRKIIEQQLKLEKEKSSTK